MNFTLVLMASHPTLLHIAHTLLYLPLMILLRGQQSSHIARDSHA